jgi:tryptophan synthase
MISATMPRGSGGRIEDAFAAAKDRGEAAFVSFVTAGYPCREGELVLVVILFCLFV